MSFTFLLHALLFAFLILPSLSSYSAMEQKDSNLIQSTCKHSQYYQLCVSTLTSNPRSSNADIPGLGVIVVDAVKAKATETLGMINKLLRSNPELKIALSQCSQIYKAVVNADVPEAIEALTKGDPKFAENGMNDAALEADICEGYFSRNKSPLTVLNRAVHQLSHVAASIARLLL